MNDRRRFLVKLGGMTVLVTVGAACSGGGDDDDAATCADTGATAVAISGNHGHAVSIPQGHLGGGTDRTYSIMGTGDHDHDVTVTAAQLASIAAGETVNVTSTTTVHSHTVSLRCNEA